MNTQNEKDGDTKVAQLRVLMQGTPNPNARKFILNIDVRTGGKAQFDHVSQCSHVPLAEELLNLPGVSSLHFFDNVITVTQNGTTEWEELAEMVEGTLYALSSDHDPAFASKEELQRSQMSPEQRQVEDILDQHIRPYLQGDGGDLEVVSIHNNVITIRYEGACGTCPSSVAGTLQAIQSTLRDQYDPEVDVVTL